MSNKTQLQTNNTALDALITRVNAAKDVAASLPEAGGSTTDGDSNLIKLLNGQSVTLTEDDLAGAVELRDYAFHRCANLTGIIIPNSVTKIGVNALSYCTGIRGSIVIPSSVTAIGNSAISYCTYLESITIPDSVTVIGTYAFSNNTHLTSVNGLGSVTRVTNYMFSNCKKLVSVTIPNNVTEICAGAFNACSALTNLFIPSSVTSIGSSAFYYCTSMTFYDFTEHTSVPTLGSTSAFSGIPSTCQIRVPSNLYDQWISATNWSTYSSKIVAV